MRHFKRRWDESRGDANDGWGWSFWYFETDEVGVVTRQIETYEKGPTLRYDAHHVDDEFSGLSDQPLDLNEFAAFEISHEQFEQVWRFGHSWSND